MHKWMGRAASNFPKKTSVVPLSILEMMRDILEVRETETGIVERASGISQSDAFKKGRRRSPGAQQTEGCDRRARRAGHRRIRRMNGWCVVSELAGRRTVSMRARSRF